MNKFAAAAKDLAAKGYLLESDVARLVELGVRSSVDAAAERMNAKIRSAQLMKVPYMLVVGEQEANNNTVSLRKRDGSRQDGMPVEQFVSLVVEKIKTRAGDL